MTRREFITLLGGAGELSRPRDAKGDPDLGGRDADTGRLWHVRGLMYYGA